MRTTLNLDPDVETRLKELARRERRSLSRTVNDVLRAGLRSQQSPPSVAPYDPPTFDTGPPLMDVRDVAQVLETLSDGG